MQLPTPTFTNDFDTGHGIISKSLKDNCPNVVLQGIGKFPWMQEVSETTKCVLGLQFWGCHCEECIIILERQGDMGRVSLFRADLQYCI